MSAPNFGQPTLSRCYTVGMEYEGDDDILDEDAWEILFDEDMAYIKEQLLTVKDVFSMQDGRVARDKQVIGGISFDYYNREYREWEEVYCYITVESGYYQGAMIDVDLEDIKELELTETFKKKVRRKLREIEKVLTKCTLPLVKTAQFSNGEAIYEKVNKNSLLKATVTELY